MAHLKTSLVHVEEVNYEKSKLRVSVVFLAVQHQWSWILVKLKKKFSSLVIVVVINRGALSD